MGGVALIRLRPRASDVSSSRSQRWCVAPGGNAKRTGSSCALNKKKSVSPTIGFPCESVSSICEPSSRTPSVRASLLHVSADISLPSGANQVMSLMAPSRMLFP